MDIQSNISLKDLNTFGLDALAAHYADVFREEDLVEAVRQPIRPLRVLGGGSNVVFTGDLDGLLLHIRIPGLEVVSEDDSTALVAAGAGENWHRFVCWTLEQNLGGLENLSLIPGSVGAAPIQNIGAYGVELKDYFEKLEAIHLGTGEKFLFNRETCQFGYRDSVFKRELRGQFAIVRVYFRLYKQHTLHTSYGAVREILAEMGIADPTIRDVSRAVIHIRRSKLPDPAILGNAGSFFKNPEVGAEKLKQLLEMFPDMPQYPLSDGGAKIPAGWLIERCGWKGKRMGEVGAHEKQALVLVNYGRATGREVLDYANQVVQSVAETFGIRLEREVNLLP